MLNLIKKFVINNYIILIISFLFFILLLRNPYSTRTLIPNLEPFPDAIYYTTIPRCFIQNLEWKMCRLHDPQIKGTTPFLPPLYPAILIPGYLLNMHVTTFYFVNILLSFISLLLLYNVAQNFFHNKFITGLVSLLFVTNYFVYWLPTLAMAENLLMPLFLLSIFLLQQKVSKKTSLLIGIVAPMFYATKYAFAPLAVIFPLIYLTKILKEKINRSEKIKELVIIFFPSLVVFLKLAGVKLIFSVANLIFNGLFDTSSSNTIKGGGGYFSYKNFSNHFIEYSHALVGKSQRFLWDRTPLTEQWVALPGILGLLTSLKHKELNYAKIWLILATIFQLFFISTFYVMDIRYVYHFLPILLLGFGFFLSHLSKTILKNKLNFYCFIFILFAIYIITNANRIKSVAAVNLKYRESPWWYQSQLESNRFFDNLDNQTHKPYLITLLSPFFVDNYTNQKYIPLPLNNQQDFKGNFEEVWGPGNYENLLNLYTEKINQGNNIYINNYGLAAAGHFQSSFDTIKNTFNLELVQSGCYNLCNIYKLSIKEANE